MKYTFRAALLCCTCYIVLFALSFIPPQSAFGVELRRANILSDLLSFGSDSLLEEIELEFDQSEYEVDLEMVEQAVVAINSSEDLAEQSYSWGADDELIASLVEEEDFVISQPSPLARLLPEVEITPIEEFDTEELSAMRRLYRKLLSPDSLVRIAVLGDSFIEADILTADLREALQSRYGGCGVGFAPMHSPLTAYRSTIKTTTSEGWTSHNVMQQRKTPEPYASLFSVGGWVSLPSAGASTTWSTTSAREHIDSCHCVRLHFVALKDCSLELSINGEQSRTFEVKGSERLCQIELQHSDIRTLTMRLLSGADGFVGYGAIFEGRTGVVVDNYSVRSNNGQAMFWTSPSINAQIDKAVGGYDLVVLQYGLNIMQSGVNKYTAYGVQVEKMISYVRTCFPQAAVLVMGVSDRSIKKDGTYRPMSEAENLTEYQREAARAQGANFWSTYSAMAAQGSMTKFVSNGWAAKDFTHINLGGGRQVAWALVDAISSAADAERKFVVVREVYEPVIDSAARAQIEQQFFK